MPKHSHHGVSSAKKMLAYGVQQGIGAFGRNQIRKKPQQKKTEKGSK